MTAIWSEFLGHDPGHEVTLEAGQGGDTELGGEVVNWPRLGPGSRVLATARFGCAGSGSDACIDSTTLRVPVFTAIALQTSGAP
jgi:hypothetical protein